MKTLPISGTMKTVSFFEDDTIETVRQLIALSINSHPDRMFLQIKGSFSKDYYSSNPKRWTELFLRLSFDGKTILADNLKTYVTQTRPGILISERDVTLEEWEDHDEYLQPIFDPENDFDEWRILGVEDVHSFVMPLPPKDIPLQAASIPIPRIQSLFETFHPYDVSEFQTTEIAEGVSEIVKRNYFPTFKPDTPNNIESLRNSIESAQAQFKRLIDMHTPKHEKATVIRAKWYIPFISTRFTAPRSRFEQMFYGITVSKETPYIGYFTAKTETMRHKFFVEDAKHKKPFIDTSMLKGWMASTQPQRRLPTLLLYRGKSRGSFDRIAITPKDITVDVRRDKESKETLDEMKADIEKWLKTLDAIVPFLTPTDLELPRWELGDLSLVASYSNDVREFDMHRFQCLQTIFGYQNDTFRLLRAEHSSDDISPREIQAYQVFSQEDAERSPGFLAKELNISIAEANELFAKLQARAEDFDIEKSLKAYPILKFSNKEVIVRFVTSLERTLQYADILRYVLTSDSDAVNEICPRRMEKVPPKVAIPQQDIDIEGEFEPDAELNALLGLTDEPEVVPEEVVAVAKPSKKVKVSAKTQGTYNYFNNRLQKFDAATFDKDIYPGKCDKPKQVIALTDADKSRMGSQYNYEDAPESEKLNLEEPNATVVCPPYWCMRDEIPLKDDQLKEGDDGELHCPVCNGKVRNADNVDTVEFSVIKRDKAAKYPDYMRVVSSVNKRKMPCCYQQPRSTAEVIAPKEDVTYVLDETSANVPGLRMMYLPKALAENLKIKLNYSKSVKKGRLSSGEADVFRIGLGRPSKTLPVLLGDKTEIPRPRDSKEHVMKCSFFRTWRDTKEGDTQIDRLISSIDNAYQNGDLSLLEEVEYVTSFLKCEVILVDAASMEVNCGFWSDTVGASSRTIAVMGNTILTHVSRRREGKGYKTDYITDLRKKPFSENTLPLLRELHTRSCATNMPTLGDAIRELQVHGKSDYQVILDPFDRIQAVFIPGEIMLPVQPSATQPDKGVVVRSGFADIRDDELPDGVEVRAFLKDAKHPGFKKVNDVQDINGQIVEFLLASGFRIPIQAEEPDEGADFAGEVLQTIRNADEKTLVDGEPNKEDIRIAQEISYSTEIFEFLMFSLSKDIQTDEFAGLRKSIETKSANLYKDLDKWFKEEAYEDTTKSPIEFVNKVRTPCGQYTQKDACSKSSLCGWHKNTCKIRVKPIVEKAAVLKRIVKALRDNDKQRSLVLDERLSPFFSTILYLEMPHELITTSF